MKKTLFRILLYFVFCLALLACAATPDKVAHSGKCIKIGQEWKYDHREGEEGSKVIVVDSIMAKDKARYYVIRLSDIKIDHPNFKNYFPDRVPYFVISEKGLEASLTKLLGEASWNRFYDRHYQNWRKKRAGPDYYGFTIKDKLNTLDEVLNVKLGA